MEARRTANDSSVRVATPRPGGLRSELRFRETWRRLPLPLRRAMPFFFFPVDERVLLRGRWFNPPRFLLLLLSFILGAQRSSSLTIGERICAACMPLVSIVEILAFGVGSCCENRPRRKKRRHRFGDVNRLASVTRCECCFLITVLLLLLLLLFKAGRREFGVNEYLYPLRSNK